MYVMKDILIWKWTKKRIENTNWGKKQEAGEKNNNKKNALI